MSRVNQAQMQKLLDLLSEDGVLVNGKVTYTGSNKQNFWKRIAIQLNAEDNGVYKTSWKWCKMWADWKNKTQKKANIILRKKHYKNGPQVAPLNSIELRLLKMIGYNLDAKPEISDVVNKVEIPDPPPDEMSDFLSENYEVPMSTSNNVSSDEDDNKTLEYLSKKDASEFDLDEEAPTVEKKVKMKGKKFKKTKISLEEFKMKSTLALEKEKLQQKNEELRLHALELKLKGEEMRMKEIEMNKINHLTSVEEEKLKCFKEIAASLKELLDRTRNGNVGLHNVL